MKFILTSVKLSSQFPNVTVARKAGRDCWLRGILKKWSILWMGLEPERSRCAGGWGCWVFSENMGCIACVIPWPFLIRIYGASMRKKPKRDGYGQIIPGMGIKLRGIRGSTAFKMPIVILMICGSVSSSFRMGKIWLRIKWLIAIGSLNAWNVGLSW